MDWKLITKVIAGIAMSVGMISGIIALDGNYARAEAVKQSMSLLAKGVQIQIDTQQLQSSEFQLTRVKHSLAKAPTDEDLVDQKLYLKDQIHFLRDRIQATTESLSQ